MKSKVISLFLLFSAGFCFADKVNVSSIVCLDESNEKIELKQNPGCRIVELLGKYYFQGLLSFDKLSEGKYGTVNSILDAERCCNVSHCEYLMYGYFQKKQNSWYGNLKLYSGNDKKIIKEFFASDSIDEYDRMIESFVTHIVLYCEELLGLNHEDILVDFIRKCEIRFPSALSYWSPLTEDWRNVYSGVIGTYGGVEIFPPLKTLVIHSLYFDYSAQLRLSYRYGFGADNNYPLNYHEINLEMPVLVHLNFDYRNSIYAGAGISFGYQILEIAEHYKPTSIYYQNMFGYFGMTGYEFLINNIVSIYSEIQLGSHFSNDKYLDIKPSLGVVFSLGNGD